MVNLPSDQERTDVVGTYFAAGEFEFDVACGEP